MDSNFRMREEIEVDEGGALRAYGFPLSRRAVRGMSHCVASACPVEPAEAGYLLVVETQEEEPGMQYRNSI
ncbi:MAG TPA: hypothetical protein VMA53_12145, partial [Stellaceae bacterium]|nr:hypothetical protein [Stellaceae bacterium]